MSEACALSVNVRGVVQGVGFRPFVFRLAHENSLSGWVLNREQGVEIHLEGEDTRVGSFLRDLRTRPPAAARIASIDVAPVPATGVNGFEIRASRRQERP